MNPRSTLSIALAAALAISAGAALQSAAAEPSAGSAAAKPGGIAFVSTRNGNDDIWVMNGDGSGQRPLTASSDDERAPAVSPDGKQILYVRDQIDNDIWVIERRRHRSAASHRRSGD
jgi:uncharacterized membrane protein